MPSNVTFTKQNLVFPNYWNNMDIPHVDQALKAGKRRFWLHNGQVQVFKIAHSKQ